MSERIWVYGTLRPGASNHFRLAGAKWLGPAQVRGRLYSLGWYPGLHLDPTANRVRGDLMLVEAAELTRLDAYEGDEYRRVRIPAGCAEPTDCAGAWVWEWLGQADPSRLIASGDWLAQR